MIIPFFFRYDDPFVELDESDTGEIKHVFGLPSNEKSHATRSAGSRKKDRGSKGSKKDKQKKSRRKKKRKKKRSGCSKERLFLNFRELGWDVSVLKLIQISLNF